MTQRLLPSLAAAALAAGGLVAPASAEFQEKDFELRLDGFAQTDVELDGTNLAIAGTLGYFFSDQLEGGIRQTLTYTDIGAEALNGGTALFADYHFGTPGERFQPFLGASLGYNYGDTVDDTFFAGPEIGVKYFLDDNDDWFVFGQLEYQFFFEDSSGADDALDDGTFLFRLGVGVLL